MRFILIALLIAPLAASAQEPVSYAGTWIQSGLDPGQMSFDGLVLNAQSNHCRSQHELTEGASEYMMLSDGNLLKRTNWSDVDGFSFRTDRKALTWQDVYGFSRPPVAGDYPFRLLVRVFVFRSGVRVTQYAFVQDYPDDDVFPFFRTGCVEVEETT